MDNCLTLKIEKGFAIIEFDQPDSKVNVLSAANLIELEKLIQELNEKKDYLHSNSNYFELMIYHYKNN